jgi:conjugal transfer/type IV secretion protein DotA/TraY
MSFFARSLSGSHFGSASAANRTDGVIGVAGILKFILLLSLLVILAIPAWAAEAPADIRAISDAATGDKAGELFKNLFGDFFNSPLSSIGGSVSGNGGLLGDLFLIFNGAVFLIGTLWAGWGLLHAVIDTAQTGEALGKKLSVVWLPIRMVVGISGIMPVFGGFSLSQVVMVTMAGIGIGMANLMWTGAVDGANKFDTLIPAGVGVQAVGGINLDQIAEDALTTVTCQIASIDFSEAQKRAGIDPLPDSEIIPEGIKVNGNTLDYQSGTLNSRYICGHAKLESSGSRSPNGGLTSFRVASVNYGPQYAGPVRDVYFKAYSKLISEIEQIGTAWYLAREASVGQGKTIAPYPLDKVSVAKDNFAREINTGLKAVANNMREEGGALSEVALANMKAGGWISAGAWFSTFAEANAAMTEIMNSVSYNYSEPVYKDMPEEVIATISGRKASIGAAKEESDDTSGSIGKIISKYVFKTETGNHSLGQAIVGGSIKAAAIGSGGGDLINPIIMFKSIGDNLIVASEFMYVTIAAFDSPGKKNDEKSMGSKISDKAMDLASYIPGVGKVISLIKTAGAILLVAFKMLAPLFLMLGISLSIYLPMVPFVTWMGGIVQYAVVVCMAVVGAPIAALSHLDSEGDGLGQRTTAGYMLMLNLTFRPALMLFGFFMASALLIGIGTLQAKLFMAAMANAQGDSITGVVSILAFLFLFFVMNVTLIQSLFNMIFLLPDQVLGLIGTNGMMTDIGKSTEDKMSHVATSGGRTAQGLSDGATKAMGEAKGRRRDLAAKQEDREYKAAMLDATRGVSEKNRT